MARVAAVELDPDRCLLRGGRGARPDRRSVGGARADARATRAVHPRAARSRAGRARRRRRLRLDARPARLRGPPPGSHRAARRAGTRGFRPAGRRSPRRARAGRRTRPPPARRRRRRRTPARAARARVTLRILDRTTGRTLHRSAPVPVRPGPMPEVIDLPSGSRTDLAQEGPWQRAFACPGRLVRLAPDSRSAVAAPWGRDASPRAASAGPAPRRRLSPPGFSRGRIRPGRPRPESAR
jgi:hypothetical protein